MNRLLCLLLGHRRLVVHARILETDGTLTPYLDLGCERCHH